MKYIKKYENKLYEEKNIFSEINKKYIIIQSTRIDIPHYILKIEKIENDILFYSDYYYLDDDGELFVNKNMCGGEIHLNDVKETITSFEYQTDNFKDVVKILKLTKNTMKYNL